MINNQDFKARRQEAIEQIQQLHNRSASKEPPSKPQAPVKAQPSLSTQDSILGGLGLPFLDNLKSDGDMTLILGILLLLLSEKADKRLLFALVYILL